MAVLFGSGKKISHDEIKQIAAACLALRAQIERLEKRVLELEKQVGRKKRKPGERISRVH